MPNVNIPETEKVKSGEEKKKNVGHGRTGEEKKGAA